MTKIFESPDHGETIYSRDFGENERHLEKPSRLMEQLQEDKMWGDIRRLAKTNVPLKDALDKVLVIYNLVKNNK